MRLAQYRTPCIPSGISEFPNILQTETLLIFKLGNKKVNIKLYFRNGEVECGDAYKVPITEMMEISRTVQGAMESTEWSSEEKQWTMEVEVVDKISSTHVQQLDRFINCSKKAEWLHPTENKAAFWEEGVKGDQGTKRTVNHIHDRTLQWEHTYLNPSTACQKKSFVCDFPEDADIAYVTQISSFYPLLGRINEGRVSVAVVPANSNSNSKTLQYRMDFSEQSMVTSSLVGRVFNNIAGVFLWVHDRKFRVALAHHYETEARITAELLKLW
eukprot:sb/3468166/